jgi:DNA-binding winged helix-turn-helix (wHTH) protein
MRTRPHLAYEFGPYRLDRAQCRLLKGGHQVNLRPKLFDLLAVLVEHHGQMLEKDELMQAVWPDLAIEENNLTVSINALRRVLGDDNYIETVSRRGYRFVAEVRVLSGEAANRASSSLAIESPSHGEPEPPGGAMPLHSIFYVARHTDVEFHAAMTRRDSIVLVKGARQVGKTSLLARGLQQAREAGDAVVLTDFQHLGASALESSEKLLLTLAELIADQLDLPVLPHQTWNNFLSPSSNFERYLRRETLVKITSGLIWGVDEADRLFNFDYAREIFGLFRSWHNLRALDPGGPWQRLTLAFAYATEAHLFITDLNQSPFNVGTRLTLEDFTSDQVAELNRRYRGPLRDQSEVDRFHELVGGHPYLTQRGLYEMVRGNLSLAEVESQAEHDEGLFGDHLRRVLASVARDAVLCDALRGVLRGEGELTQTNFYRLRSGGVLVGDSPQVARLRCELYGRYLRRHLQ